MPEWKEIINSNSSGMKYLQKSDLFLEQIKIIGDSIPEYVHMCISGHQIKVKVNTNGIINFGPLPIRAIIYSQIGIKLDNSFEITYSDRNMKIDEYNKLYCENLTIVKNGITYYHHHHHHHHHHRGIKSDLIIYRGCVIPKDFKFED